MSMIKKGVVDPSETPVEGQEKVAISRALNEDCIDEMKAEEDQRFLNTVNGLDDDLTKRLSDKATESL